MEEPTPRLSSPNSNLGEILAFLSLRIWLAVRALQAGIEKFAGTKASAVPVPIDGEANPYGLTEQAAEKIYSLDSYAGVPAGLYKQFEGEPFIPGFALTVYDYVLGPTLIILGILLFLGIASRVTLFLMALLYTSLTYGLILLNQSAGIAWLGTHLILIAIALILSKHNRLALVRSW